MADFVDTASPSTSLAVPGAPQRKVGHRFQKGHPCFYRRAKDTTLRSAISSCVNAAFNPIEAMIRIFTTGVLIDASGVKTPVPVHLRLKLLRELATYTHPKAPNVTVGVTPSSSASKDFVNRIMNDPALLEAADSLFDAVSRQDAKDRAEPFLLDAHQNPSQ